MTVSRCWRRPSLGGWYLATKGRCSWPARPGRRELPAQPPVAANQPAFGAPNTNTMGAMQGWGRLTVALMSEFPAVLAGNGAVLAVGVGAAPAGPDGGGPAMAVKARTRRVAPRAGGNAAPAPGHKPRTG